MPSEPSARKRVPVGALLGILIGLAVIAALVWLVAWSLGREADMGPSFDENRTAWGSAMAKASVEATFPGGPVDVADIRAVGSRPFSATFSPAELQALLAVYRYRPQDADSVSLGSVAVSIPQPGWIALSGRIVLDGTAYSARARGPVSWDGGVRIDEGAASVSVEGFGLEGEQKRQALNAVEGYMTGLLSAAPGLVIKEATVSQQGIDVTGTAPVRLEHQEPAAP